MDLSIVIVNYNVKHFLEQCLHSVYKATKNMAAEVFVVDNNSVDGSCALVKEKFPKAQLIENKKNTGFSKANNQAIKLAKGEYVLLLNPDTVVEEDTFEKVVGFMNKHPEAGGLGVKMIDGKGQFLPESKRGLPTPMVAFYKIFGLASLFPKSKKFGKYHLSYLDKEKIHEVDVLAGAFMLLRASTLEKTGLLDETFFMYGEDIDLSYRITKSGYKNYYYPHTTIIHYKGESTKKGSLNYVKVFYNAMIIFANKHFSSGRAKTFSFLIQLAIYFRAFLSIIKRILKKILIPIIDALLIFGGYLLITPHWESYQYFKGYYPDTFYQYAIPAYIVIWILTILSSGGYKKPFNIYKLLRGIIWGLIAILIIHSLVNQSFRFSRALILLGAVWALIVLPISRYLLNKTGSSGFKLERKKNKRYIVVGNVNEGKRVQQLMQNSSNKTDFVGLVAANEQREKEYLGNIHQLEEIVKINKIDEVIFCSEDLNSGEIIRLMLNLSSMNLEYKIAPPESISIIGSNSIHTAGDFYVLNINTIVQPVNKLKKRAFDIITTSILLFISPVTIWMYRYKKQLLKNCVNVLQGKISWVGFINRFETDKKLPTIKNGVLNPEYLIGKTAKSKQIADHLNMMYAKDYKLITDTEILLKGRTDLDKKVTDG